MIYCAPTHAASEVSSLAEAGAGELYCGIQEAWWQVRYGDHDSISRRQGRANLSTRDELARLAAEAQLYDLPLYLALNGHYDEEQLDYLMELCAAFERMGGTGVIVRDLGLLWRLRKAGSGLSRVLSLLAVCASTQSARAFAELGVCRIVFPRFMDAAMAGEVLRAVPGMEAESMVFFDKCPLVDGYCEHYHGVGYAPRTGTDANLEGKPLHTFCTTYVTHACLGSSRMYVNPDPCGACEMAAFERMGVRFGKLGGRGRPLSERIRALMFLRKAEACTSDGERAALYRQVFGHACSCYYGTARQRGNAIEAPVEARDSTRVYAGSQTQNDRLPQVLAALNAENRTRPLTLLFSPQQGKGLTGEELETLREWLQRRQAHAEAGDVHLCVNDVGTLTTLSDLADPQHRVALTAGSLLVGGGVPVELERFLSPADNPPRAVWDADDNPRVLTYHKPPRELRDHWMQGLRLDARPSLQAALSFVAGGRSVAAEFALT